MPTETIGPFRRAVRGLFSREPALPPAFDSPPPEPLVVEPPTAPPPAIDAGVGTTDRFVKSLPSPQNAVDIFRGEWSSRLPDAIGVQCGEFPLFEDPRIRWALGAIGGVQGKRVLELGPLEGGHTYMLEQAGAEHVTAIEANVRAFLKCLVVKEITGLRRVEFRCGDFVEFLTQNTNRYDVILACGVLYHMTEPLRFLQMLSRITDSIVMFTHYYDEALIRANERTSAFFEGTVEAQAGGFACTLYPQRYAADNRVLLGFSGGTELFSCWMRKDDMQRALRHFGFCRIETSFDQPDHPNGPGFALVACRY